MKKFYSLLATCLLFAQLSFAQCEIPNGNFESFIEVTEELENQYNVDLEEPVYTAEGYISAFRFFLLFSDLFDSLIGSELVDAVGDIYGQERVEPGAEGSQYALKLVPDDLFSIADVISAPFACGERPTYFQGFYSHAGLDEDILFVIAALGNEGFAESAINIANPDELANNPDVIGFVYEQIIGGADSYTAFQYPITYNTAEVPDSAMIAVLAISDSASLAAGNESYYIIDEFKFSAFPLGINDLSTKIQVFPNPAQDFIAIESPEAIIEKTSIYDSKGQLILEDQTGATKINIQQLPTGLYHLEIEANNQRMTKQFVKE